MANGKNRASLRIWLILNRYFPVVGGTETQASRFAPSLQQRGHHVTIITRRLKSEYPASEVLDGVPIRRLSPIGLSSLANAFMVFRMAFYLIIHAREYDIAYSFTLGPVGLAALLASIFTRKPVVICSQTYGDISRLGGSNTHISHFMRTFIVPTWLWRFFLNRADRFIAISHEIMQEGSDFGVGGRMLYVPNGVDTVLFAPPTPDEKRQLRQQLVLSIEDNLLVYTGRMIYRKRLDVAIRAMPKILDKHPSTKLLIVGGGRQHADDISDSLIQLISKLGLEGAVQFVGLVKNVPDYLQAADIYTFPSEREGLPNAVLEAASCRLPIVASRIGGIVDALSDEEAWLVTAGDVDAFANAVIEALDYPDLAGQKARAARQRIESEFSMRHVTDVLEGLYWDLLGKNA